MEEKKKKKINGKGFVGDLASDLLSKTGKGKKQQRKRKNGAGLSDIFGAIGKITPFLSKPLGFMGNFGKVGQIGNSVLGSTSRVGADIADMLGLGRKRKKY